MINTNKLPRNWQIASLSEVSNKITDGSHNPPKEKSSGIAMISAKDVHNNYISFDSPRLISEEEFEIENRRTQIEPGDILLTIVATIGRAAVVPKNTKPFALQRSVAVIKTNLNSSFLCYFFQSPLFQKQLINSAKGTAQKGIYLKALAKLEIIVPPLSEQQRIVGKIEELFSELDMGLECLKTVQTLLESLRQAILRMAFEGKLTNDNVNEGDLPAGWRLTNLGELKDFSIYGPRYSSKEYKDDGVAVLRTTDISDRGKVDWINSPKLELSDDDYEKYKLEKGDLLITRTGSIGTISVFNDDKRAIPGAFLIHYRLKEGVNTWFVFYFLKSQKAQKHFKEHSFGVGRPNLNVPNIELLDIPLCSLEEQQRIVQEIESRLSICDKLEESITSSLRQAEVLRQSILKKAFEGKLVTQDENDEPASVLLERINNERELFLKEERLRKKDRPRIPKSKTMEEQSKSVLQLLQESNKPVATHSLWQSSKHKNDIDGFYAEIKELMAKGEIEETHRVGKEAFLTLAPSK